MRTVVSLISVYIVRTIDVFIINFVFLFGAVLRKGFPHTLHHVFNLKYASAIANMRRACASISHDRYLFMQYIVHIRTVQLIRAFWFSFFHLRASFTLFHVMQL